MAGRCCAMGAARACTWRKSTPAPALRSCAATYMSHPAPALISRSPGGLLWQSSGGSLRTTPFSASTPMPLDTWGSTANLGPAIAGCATAIRRFLHAGTGGGIVNISSHQAQRAVRGALPYVTAKAAVEGLTRALAVDYGPQGIRVNAVALGSISTGRYHKLLAQQPAAAARIEAHMSQLHPLGRLGRTEEVAAAVSYLLSAEASFINGAIVPVDGGRSVLGLDPEQA